jgi:hypothetical protein
MTLQEDAGGFELARGFDKGTLTGGLELGPYAAQYGELFAHALEDGVITAEERERLDKAADNLGISPVQLRELERAMVNAYETHHRVKVALRSESRNDTSPAAAPTAATTREPAQLLAQIERLTQRIAQLEEELREARSHVNVEIDLTGLSPGAAASDESVEQLQAKIRRDPANPELFARLHHAAAHDGDRDLELRAAQALVLLGAAEPAQAAFAAEYQPKGLLTPKRALSPTDWNGALIHPEFEVVTGQILSLITPAALMGRVAGLRSEGKLSQPPDSQKQDPQRSTVMSVRALAWGATVLGMPTPVIYTDLERVAAYAIITDLPPYSVAGKAVLSGRTQLENAFLAARHMAYYRGEFFVKVMCPAVTDLEDLFLAALLVGSPSLPIAKHVKARVEPIGKALQPLLEPERRDALREQFKAFVADGGRTNLLAFCDAIDKTACRAGLLLCGDLSNAARVLAEEEGPEGPLRADLLGFHVSERHGELRRRLGIGIA